MTIEEYLANPGEALKAAQGATVELTEEGEVVAFISVPRATGLPERATRDRRECIMRRAGMAVDATDGRGVRIVHQCMEAEAARYAELVEAAESKAGEHKRRNWHHGGVACECEICRALANLETKS